MGSKASKIKPAVRARKYPTRVPAPSSPKPQPMPAEVTERDTSYQDMLRSIRIAQVHGGGGTVGGGGGANPILAVSRQRALEEEQKGEAAGGSGRMRSWVDVSTAVEILRLRDEKGWDAGRIEKGLGLAEGVVGRLGGRVGNV